MPRCGIRNNGSTCFINATLQCLAASPFIRNFISNYETEDIKLVAVITKFNLGKLNDADDIKAMCLQILKTSTNTLVESETAILKHIAVHSKDIYTYIVIKQIIKSLNENIPKIINIAASLSIIKDLSVGSGLEHLFNGEQNDPHEFMLFILEKLHNAKKTTVSITIPANLDIFDKYHKLYLTHFKTTYQNNYSYFVKNLYFYILTCIECDKCKMQTESVCPNQDICVSIPDNILNPNSINIYDCLNEMFKVEAIDYKCENVACKNTISNKWEKKIISTPKTLIIKIKRYYNSRVNNHLSKNNTMIQYPKILDIKKYLCSESNSMYELYAIINHTGSLDSGHYYSYVKTINHETSQFTSEWVGCNDTNVQNITEEYAMSSQNAYILFYNLIQ